MGALSSRLCIFLSPRRAQKPAILIIGFETQPPKKIGEPFFEKISVAFDKEGGKIWAFLKKRHFQVIFGGDPFSNAEIEIVAPQRTAFLKI